MQDTATGGTTGPITELHKPKVEAKKAPFDGNFSLTQTEMSLANANDAKNKGEERAVEHSYAPAPCPEPHQASICDTELL